MPNPAPHTIDAARLALLGLRARVSSPSQPLARVYRLGAGTLRIPEGDLLEQLAAATKPILPSAELDDGVLRVDWQSYADAPHLFQFHLQCLEDARNHGGVMGFLPLFYVGTPETLQVFCAGGEESLVLPLVTVEQWFADYADFGFSADGVDNPHAKLTPIYTKARSLGAVGVLRFRSALNP